VTCAGELAVRLSLIHLMLVSRAFARTGRRSTGLA
jgi:hypothetical protein